MLTTIQGFYENGQILLQELPPVSARTPVIVTFLPEPGTAHRRLGSLKGKVGLPDDFNEPLEDLKDYMH